MRMCLDDTDQACKLKKLNFQIYKFREYLKKWNQVEIEFYESKLIYDFIAAKSRNKLKVILEMHGLNSRCCS